MNLQGKVIVVTAATRGIGLACVTRCAREGATVYLAARNPGRAQAQVEQLKGCDVRWVYCDATKPDTIAQMIDTVMAQSGAIHGLVNNFGTSDPRQDLDFARTDCGYFLELVTLNLRSVFLTSQLAARYMAAGTGGSIVNISSVGGAIADLSQVAYGTSKAAINHLTRLIAVHEAHHGIRCNAILPGMTATDAVTQHLTPDFRSRFLRHIPLGRMGQPEEIAAATAFLLSPDAAYITGQTLSVSGGFGLASPLYGDAAAGSRT